MKRRARIIAFVTIALCLMAVLEAGQSIYAWRNKHPATSESHGPRDDLSEPPFASVNFAANALHGPRVEFSKGGFALLRIHRAAPRER